MSEKRTGLYIYELDELIGNLKEDACFALTQDNVTRRMSARTFRHFINGDNDEPSDETYYSSSKIENLFENTGSILDEINGDISNINQRIDDLTNIVNSNYKTLDDRITTEINNLRKYVDDSLNSMRQDMADNVAELERKINALDNKLTSWILYGTAVPTNSSLPAGRLYIQYFTS